MDLNRKLLLASAIIAILLATPVTYLDQSEAADGTPAFSVDDYVYKVTYNTGDYQASQITGVYKNGSTVLETPVSHDSSWNYDAGSWGWSSETGMGPFNMFYAAISTGQADPNAMSTAKGHVAYILDPMDLTKAVIGKEMSRTDISSVIGKYNIMLVIPTVYWYSDGAGNLYISNSSGVGDERLPAEVRGKLCAFAHTVNGTYNGATSTMTGGTVYPFMAIGVYEAIADSTYGLMSKSGVTPTASKSLTGFRGYLSSANSGVGGLGTYHILNFYEYTLYKMLSQTVIGSKDSVNVIGLGNGNSTDASQKSTTGNGNVSGPYASSGTTMSGNSSYSKLFIENSWGSQWELLDNAFVVSNKIRAGSGLNPAGSSYAIDGSDYTGGNVKTPSTAGIIGKTYPASPVWDLAQGTTSGSVTSASNDQFWNGGSDQVIRVGGNHRYGGINGLSTWSSNHAIGNSGPDIGTRVAYMMSLEAVGFGVTYERGSSGDTGEPPSDARSYILGQEFTLEGKGDLVYTDEPRKEFIGWEYEGKIYAAGEKIPMPNHPVTLKSYWDHPYVTVVFDKNSPRATGEMSDQLVGFESRTQLKANSFKQEGYALSKWSGTGSDGKLYEFEDKDEVFIGGTGSMLTITLRAQWLGVYKLSFNENGGTGLPPETEEVMATASVILPDYEGEKGSRVFAGWQCDGRVYAAGEPFTMPYRDVLMIAVWESGEHPAVEEEEDDIFDLLRRNQAQQEDSRGRILYIEVIVAAVALCVASCLVIAVWRRRCPRAIPILRHSPSPIQRVSMKTWEFTKVKGSSIRIDNWMSDTMGVVEGGCIYSTLFKHPVQGPKEYEIIISMFPQENYRTLTHITMYLDDVPGSSAQAAAFLAHKEINVLNSISLNGISDTVIVWKLMADLNFAGEGELLLESFESLKAAGDPSVSKIKRIDIKPAEIGRLFKGGQASNGKEEIRRGYPTTLKDGCFDLAELYGDILGDIDGENVLLTMDADSWIMSVTLFKPATRLIKVGMEIPDCPGGITQVLNVIAGWNVNLISVFSKVKICYQTMYLELVMDIGKSDKSAAQIQELLPKAMDGLNGVFRLVEFAELE